MIHRARAKQCFLMEAMWMRFIPVIQKAIQWVQDGFIGEVQMVQADFGFRVPFQARSERRGGVGIIGFRPRRREACLTSASYRRPHL